MDARDTRHLTERRCVTELRVQKLDDATEPNRSVARLPRLSRCGRQQIETSGLDRHRRQVVRVGELCDQPSAERARPSGRELVDFAQQPDAWRQQLGGRRIGLDDDDVRAARAEMVAVSVTCRFGVDVARTVVERPASGGWRC